MFEVTFHLKNDFKSFDDLATETFNLPCRPVCGDMINGIIPHVLEDIVDDAIQESKENEKKAKKYYSRWMTKEGITIPKQLYICNCAFIERWDDELERIVYDFHAELTNQM